MPFQFVYSESHDGYAPSLICCKVSQLFDTMEEAEVAFVEYYNNNTQTRTSLNHIGGLVGLKEKIEANTRGSAEVHIEFRKYEMTMTSSVVKLFSMAGNYAE